jgi:virulence factor Mce-like protein
VSAKPKIRRHTPRISNVMAGLIGVVVIAAACYFVFGGSLPWSSSPFVLRAAFTANTDLHIPSPVRIAGVDVGQVVAVKPIAGSRNAGIVTMDIDPSGLPIHSDATATIRSRIFLEGNFYVQLAPGSAGAPVLHSGAELPAANTAGPVQVDRVLSSLDSNARSDLQALVRGFGTALNAPPTAADKAGQEPSVAPLTGAQALNQNLRYAAGAFEASAIVNQALLGERPHDLSGVVGGSAKVFGALGRNGRQLQGLVNGFQRTMTALAVRQAALAATISALPPLLRAVNASDAQLGASFAPTQTFARQVLPGVKQLSSTIDAALPWLSQTTALVSPAELGDLLHFLTPAVQKTSASVTAIEQLLSASGQLAACFNNVLLPTSDQVIKDPPGTTGLKVYQELLQSAVGIAGAAQNFDGNGRYVRASAGGGSQLVQTATLPGSGALYGNAVLSPLGTRPAFPGKAPPLDSSRACSSNPVPNLSAAKTGGGP